MVLTCRCDDKDMYNRDLERITQAKTYAENIVNASSNIDEALGNLKIKYSSTVKSTEDFPGEFDNVNKDATSSAQQISILLDGVEQTVREYLKAATIEDDAYHESLKTHGFESIM